MAVTSTFVTSNDIFDAVDKLCPDCVKTYDITTKKLTTELFPVFDKEFNDLLQGLIHRKDSRAMNRFVMRHRTSNIKCGLYVLTDMVFRRTLRELELKLENKNYCYQFGERLEMCDWMKSYAIQYRGLFRQRELDDADNLISCYDHITMLWKHGLEYLLHKAIEKLQINFAGCPGELRLGFNEFQNLLKFVDSIRCQWGESITGNMDRSHMCYTIELFHGITDMMKNGAPMIAELSRNNSDNRLKIMTGRLTELQVCLVIYAMCSYFEFHSLCFGHAYYGLKFFIHNCDPEAIERPNPRLEEVLRRIKMNEENMWSKGEEQCVLRSTVITPAIKYVYDRHLKNFTVLMKTSIDFARNYMGKEKYDSYTKLSYVDYSTLPPPPCKIQKREDGTKESSESRKEIENVLLTCHDPTLSVLTSQIDRGNRQASSDNESSIDREMEIMLKHADFTLSCGEKKIKVNKCVLAARSDFFATMFDFDYRISKNENDMVISSDMLSEEGLDLLVDLIYKRVRFDHDDDDHVMIAEFFMLNSLI